ncbi:MAG: PIN domain-containing protein [Saprospiraceae bacterium]|nr:PIN domain-containing protein [Saprospiraceae bacterium]
MPEDEQSIFVDLIDRVQILGISSEIANQTAALRKEIKIKLPDAIIASTALVHQLELITRNTSDFSKIQGIRLVNPHDV